MSKGRLFIHPTHSTLYVDGRYYGVAKQAAPCNVALWDEFKKTEEKRIGFDSASVSYDGYLALQKMLPHVEWVPMANPVKKLRVLKDREEVAALDKAQHLTWLGIQRIKELFREGVTEQELALEFEIYCRRHGASALSFEPIIAFGEHGAYPHYRSGNARLRKDQSILIDVGAVVDRYHGDMTRMFHFGSVDPRIAQFEWLVKEAQMKAIQQVRPGVRLGALDQLVQDAFEKANVKQLYIHTLGHGIGIETHEYPRIRFDGDDKDLILEPGMVFTIEPGLYLPGVGGVRIEDMILVTETGHKVLGHVKI
jgi:Xaa-Pro aminopeptidase